MSVTQDARWWSPDFKEERHRKVIDVVLSVRNRQERWRKRDLLHACLYGNMEILGFGPSNFWKFGQDDGRLTMNIIKPKVDTWVSMMCRSKEEPMFLPNGSGGAAAAEMWTLRRRCKEMERFCSGKMEETKFHTEIEPLAVLDVGIFDYGIAKVYITGVDDQTADWKKADVCIERAYPHEMVINDAEAMHGTPRTLAQRRPVDKFVLAAKFPKKKAEILDCPRGFQPDEGGTNDEDADVICVTEIWHLPSADEEGDGLHCMVIENATLIDEKYESNRFPFSRLTQMPVPFGIRGQSIAHQLRPIQVSINQMLLDFQDAVHTLARPKWLSPRQGGIDKAHFDDQVGSIIEFDAPYKPEPWCPTTLPPDAYQFFKDQWELADQIIGISGGKSGGTVPTNLKSGKAIEESNDTQDGRFLISSGIKEAWAMDVVDLVIDKSRIIAKNRSDYASRYILGKKSVMIDFGKVDMQRDQYTLDCYPASALANTPGARYDQLKEMKDDGTIDLPTYRRLLDWPDIEGAVKQLNAPQDLAEMLIERYLNADDPDDPDVYLAPEGRWPLQTIYEKFLYATVDAQTDGCPDANLGLMNRFMTQLEAQAVKIGLQLPGMPPPNQGAANTAPALGVPGGSPSPMMPGGAMAGAPPPMAGPPMPPGAPPMPAAPPVGAA